MPGLGARPSLPDHRDRTFLGVAAAVDSDLRSDSPLIWDQGSLGSCVPHGVLRAVNHSEKVQGLTAISPSALFVYYNGRLLEGTTDYDSGLYVRDGMKAVNRWGVATRWTWPYDIPNFTAQPSEQAYADGRGEIVVEYAAVASEAGIHAALGQRLPVVFGITVYPSFFDTSSDGRVPMPLVDEAPAGGHCMLIEGYRAATDEYIVANSWGTSWGDEGYCYMASSIFSRNAFADDLWVVKRVV